MLESSRIKAMHTQNLQGLKFVMFNWGGNENINSRLFVVLLNEFDIMKVFERPNWYLKLACFILDFLAI